MTSSDLVYVVPPTRVSPPHGQLQKKNPWFREPYLLKTDHGFVTVFMEIPADDSSNRLGWSCTSPAGRHWACSPIDRGPTGTDFADAWMADTRGDPCPVNGRGITLAALRHSADAVLEPVSYFSPDFGKTWVGPTVLPYPEGIKIPLADGSKMIYTGRSYIAWRDFTFATGEYISQLQTVNGKCSWSVPARLTTTVGPDGSNTTGYDDGSDHPRLAATPTAGEVAMRGSFGDGDLLTYHRFDTTLHQKYQSIIGSASHGEDALETCPTPTDCAHQIDELAQTLLYTPDNKGYVTVYSKYDTGGPSPLSIGLWAQRSTDTGQTWSTPVQLAGPSVDSSYIVMEENLSLDKTTGDVVLAYIEVPKQSSYDALLRIQVLHKGASGWTTPRTIQTLRWGPNPGSEKRFGDYFGMQADGGVVYIDDGLIDKNNLGYIEFFAVCYAPKLCPTTGESSTSASPAADADPTSAARATNPGSLPTTGPPPWLAWCGLALLATACGARFRRRAAHVA